MLAFANRRAQAEQAAQAAGDQQAAEGLQAAEQGAPDGADVPAGGALAGDEGGAGPDQPPDDRAARK